MVPQRKRSLVEPVVVNNIDKGQCIKRHGNEVLFRYISWDKLMPDAGDLKFVHDSVSILGSSPGYVQPEVKWV